MFTNFLLTLSLLASLHAGKGGAGSGSNTGDVTLTSIGSSANANGASLSGQILNLQPASASFGGVVGSGAQSFPSGTKTFTGAIAATNFSGSSSGTNTNDVSLSAIGSSPNANGATLTSQALNLEPASASFGGIITTGTQTLAGAKTFSAAVTGASFIPTSSSVPANGMYLPASNAISFSTNSTKVASIGSTGAAVIGSSAVNTTQYLTVGNASNSANVAITGVNQTGIALDYTGSSAATTKMAGVDSFIRTEDAIYTTALVANFIADTIQKGTQHTITRSVQYLASGDLTVGTNNAIFADSTSFSAGNWAVILASTNPSKLGGTLGVGGANTTVAVVNAGATNPLTTTNQSAYSTTIRGTSAATSSVRGFNSDVGTAGSSFTSGFVSAFFGSVTAGAGSTITRGIIFDGSNGFTATGTITNQALLTDNQGFSGAYSLHLSSVLPSNINGPVVIGSSNGFTGTTYLIRATTSGTSPLTGVTQYGVQTDPTFTSASTTDVADYIAKIQTTNASYTTPLAAGFSALTAVKGGSNTITRLVNYLGVNQTVGTGNCFLCDNTSFSTANNWFINSTSTNKSDIAGNLQHGGTATNDNATAGYVGEYVESIVSAATNFPTTTQYGDGTSISLTAGDWDITAQLTSNLNGSTTTAFEFGISTTTGNSSTGLVAGDSSVQCLPPTDLANSGNSVSVRVSLSGTTTYYLKVNATYSAGNPQYRLKLMARRRR